MRPALCLMILYAMLASAGGEGVDEDLMGHSLYYGIVATGSLRPHTDVCAKQMDMVAKNIANGTRWAVKMLDASGTPNTGLYFGNTFWLGNKKQCQYAPFNKTMPTSSLVGPVYVENESGIVPFDVSYFSVFFLHDSLIMSQMHMLNEHRVTLGVCLPASCTESQVASVVQEYFDSGRLHHRRIYNMTMTTQLVHRVESDYSWLYNTSTAIFLSCLVFAIVMSIFGTYYDLKYWQPTLNDAKESNGVASSNGVENHKETHASLPHQILKCFSVYSNTKIIFSDAPKTDMSVNCVHGMRALSMSYIVIGHTLYFSLPFLYNRAYPIYISNDWLTQLFTNAHFAVDSFFCIGGFVLTFMFNMSETSSKRKKSVAEKVTALAGGIFKRYLRFIPSYIVAISFTLMIFNARLKATHFLPFTERNDLICPQYWWRNLLFITNFYDENSICMVWTWYLSNDFQYFILASCMLTLSTLYFKAAVLTTLGALILTAVYTASLTYAYGLIPVMGNLNRLRVLFYFNPLIRLNAYIIGAFGGYLLFKFKRTLRLSKTSKILIWTTWASVVLFMLLYFGDYRMSLASSMAYMTFSRPVWALCTLWVIYACETGNGGILTKLLNLKVWLPMSRVSLWGYLINPTVVYFLTSFGEQSLEADVNTQVIASPGYFIWTLLCAFVMTLLFESPTIGLLQIMTKRKSKKLNVEELKHNSPCANGHAGSGVDDKKIN